MLRRFLSALAVITPLVLSSSCSTTSSVVMVDRIREGNGYALIVAHTNWQPWELGLERLQLHYRGLADQRTGKVRMRRSGALELVELPAGDYRWSEVQLGAQRVDLSEDSGFTVIEGTITYIGDILASYDAESDRLVDVHVENNEVAVREQAGAANAPLIERYGLATRIMTLVPEPPLPGAGEEAARPGPG